MPILIQIKGLNAKDTELTQPYDYTESFSAKYGKLIPELVKGDFAPAQLEIHPPSAVGRARCWLSCPHCYGDGEQAATDDEKMDVSTALKILSDIRDRVPRVVISGTYSDPLFSDMTGRLITAARESNARIGLHTKLLKLQPELENALLEGCRDGDYLTVSLDAGTSSTYDLVHGVRVSNSNVQKYSVLLDQVEKNLSRVCNHIRMNGLPLRVNLNYLLTELNVNMTDIEAGIDLAIRVGVDVLRFSAAQPQTLALIDKPFITTELLEQAKTVIGIQMKAAKRQRPAIIIQEFQDWNLSTFQYCYSQLLYPTVGADGFLYPCCQIATKDFKHLRIGDLRFSSFWDLWRGEARRRLILMPVGERHGKEEGRMNCRVCNRRDGAINTMVEERYPFFP